MPVRAAIIWTLLWAVAAALFGYGIWYYAGPIKAAEFFTVYTIEKLLSFDNLFVFLLVFEYFKVGAKDRRRVLNYGLAGAFIFRAIFIFLGISLVEQFNWLLYILAAFLIYSSYGVAFGGGEDEIESSRIIKFTTALSLPPILIWIIAVEITDIIFAIDSIPASLAVSQDIFIIYSANVFAILGLRSLYFVIQYLYEFIPRLKYGIALTLVFMGLKMLLPLADIHIPSIASLLTVLSILSANCLIVFCARNQTNNPMQEKPV